MGLAGCQSESMSSGQSCGSGPDAGLRPAGKMDEGQCVGGESASLVIVWGEVVITD